MTRKETGTLPTSAVAALNGARGELPGRHRNKHGQDWIDFLNDIAQNGIQDPIFITVDHGEDPVISEGNHRRDAALELGLAEVPVEISYFGNAQEAGTVGDRDHFHFSTTAAKWTWDVSFSTDKDTLKAGEVESGTRRIVVDAPSEVEARLMAEQQVASMGLVPNRWGWSHNGNEPTSVRLVDVEGWEE